jgi:hypothetical protein
MFPVSRKIPTDTKSDHELSNKTHLKTHLEDSSPFGIETKFAFSLKTAFVCQRSATDFQFKQTSGGIIS